MRAAIVVVAVAMLVGCQSTQNSWHMENDVLKNTRVERYPAMWTAPYTKTLHQQCPTSARLDATMYEGYDKLKFAECVTMTREINGVVVDHWDQAFEPGTLNGMGGNVLQAGAIAFAGHQIGRGLKTSGTNVNQNVSQSNTSNNNVDVRASTVNPNPPKK